MGPYVTRSLVAQGHSVTLFHRGQTHTELPDSVQQIHGDRRQMVELKAQFAEVKPDVVVDMLAMFEADGHALVKTFRGVAKRLVLISSMDVYRVYGQINHTEERSEPPTAPFDEDGPLRSNMYPYRSHSKQAGDFFERYDKILVERIVSSEPELPATILRLPAVYGPGDKQHRVGTYLKEMESGDVKLSSAQAQWRWTRGYVEDVAEAIALAATDERASGRLYNVGEPSALTELEWVRAIARAAQWDGPVTIEESSESDKLDHQIHLEADTNRIRRELGFAETTSHEEGLKRSVEWERANREE